MTAIPAANPAPVIVSVEYSSDAVTWARLYDNHAIGWLVDESGAAAPVPLMIGTLPLPATDSETASPQWGEFIDPVIAVPNQARMDFSEFLTWLATNNGAQRKLGSGLLNPALANYFGQWTGEHPDLWFDGDPPVVEAVEKEEPEPEHHNRHHRRHRG